MTPEHDSLRIWEVLGTWAAAIGTIAAVVVSLRLARNAERPRLAVNCDRRILIDASQARDPGHIQPDEMPDILSLEVTNIGSTRVRINSVGWHWIFIRGRGALQNPPLPEFRSHNLPAVLEHGDQLQWALPFDYLVQELAANMLAGSWWWRLKLELLCVNVWTSTGHRFRARLEPTLKKAFADEVARIRAARKIAKDRSA